MSVKTFGIGTSSSKSKRNRVDINLTPKQREKSRELAEAIERMNNNQQMRPTRAFNDIMERQENVQEASDHLNRSAERSKDKLKKVTDYRLVNEFKNNVIKEAVSGYFGSLVYEAVPLDEAEKENNLDTIYSIAYNCFKEEIYNVASSPYFEDLKGIVTDHINVADYNADHLPKGVISRIAADMTTEDYRRKELVEMVQNKVIEAVRTEGLQAKFIQEKKENNKWYDKSKTLFRTMMEADVDILLKEGANPETINEKAMMVAMVEYTVLEMLNTTQLTEEVSVTKLREGIRYLHLEETSLDSYFDK